MNKTPAELPKRAAIYTRISEDRTGKKAGVERQREDCKELVANFTWQLVDLYEDNDISAYSGKRRRRFEDLLADMKAGQVDAVVCWHADRLYRSMKDLEQFIEIADATGITIRTVNSGELDLSTSAGRIVARILGSVARQESEHLGERRVRAYIQKAQTGTWETSNRPFGYTMTGVPLEPEATALRTAVADVLEGKSIQAVARQWNAAGLTTTRGVAWRAPRVRRVLLNPRYAGLKVHRGKVVAGVTGDWTPLIDVDTHQRLVIYLSDPTRITTTSWERRYQGAGIYRCGVCGGPMKSHQAGGPNQGQTYVCRRKGCVVRNARHLDDHVGNAILEHLAEQKLVVGTKRGEGVGQLQDERATWVSKLDNLVDLLEDGTLDSPKARTRAAEYKAEIAAIDRKLAAALRESPASRMLATGEDLRARWDKMDATLRSRVIDELVTVTVLPAKRGRGFDEDSVDIAWK